MKNRFGRLQETTIVTPPEAVGPGKQRRYHGTLTLYSTRAGRDAGRITDEVIAHLAGQLGAQVTATLEIETWLPGGASDQIVRIVTENDRTLKLTSHWFENE